MNTQRTDGRRVTEVLPVRWQVVDKDGEVRATFSHRDDAFTWARLYLPGGQDTTENNDEVMPNGWDVQAVQP